MHHRLRSRLEVIEFKLLIQINALVEADAKLNSGWALFPVQGQEDST